MEALRDEARGAPPHLALPTRFQLRPTLLLLLRLSSIALLMLLCIAVSNAVMCSARGQAVRPLPLRRRIGCPCVDIVRCSTLRINLGDPAVGQALVDHRRGREVRRRRGCDRLVFRLAGEVDQE